jgi:hypothetical protein
VKSIIEITSTPNRATPVKRTKAAFIHLSIGLPDVVMMTAFTPLSLALAVSITNLGSKTGEAATTLSPAFLTLSLSASQYVACGRALATGIILFINLSFIFLSLNQN